MQYIFEFNFEKLIIFLNIKIIYITYSILPQITFHDYKMFKCVLEYLNV